MKHFDGLVGVVKPTMHLSFEGSVWPGEGRQQGSVNSPEKTTNR